MKDKKSILEYLYEFKKIWKNENIIEELTKAKDMILEVNKNNGKIFIFGNGGSLSIADHFAVDMTKNASVSTLSLGNSSMITCLSNDYGYDKWISKSIEYYVNDNDLVILISSSGSSLNIINAANICNEKKEIKLKYELEKNVNLVNFERNRIEISFNENLDKSFVKELSSKLYEWTGERWIISFSKEIGQMSLKQQADNDKKKLINDIKKTKLYNDFIKMFPGCIFR